MAHQHPELLPHKLALMGQKLGITLPMPTSPACSYPANRRRRAVRRERAARPPCTIMQMLSAHMRTPFTRSTARTNPRELGRPPRLIRRRIIHQEHANTRYSTRNTHGHDFRPGARSPPQMHTASSRQAQADRARVYRPPNGNEDGIPSLPDANPHQEHANARLPARHTHGHEYDPDACGPH